MKVVELPLTEYELQRLENVKRNREVLADLDLTRSVTPKKIHVKKDHRPVERRSSRRLKSLPPPKLPVPLELEGSHGSSSNFYSDEAFKGDLDMDKVKEDGDEEWDGLQHFSHSRELTADEERQDKELVERMESLQLRESFTQIKVNQERIYSMCFHPTTDKIIIFSSDKRGGISIAEQDIATTSEDAPRVHQYRPHSKPVTSVIVHPFDSSKIYSSSYDGTLRCLNGETKVFEEIAKVNAFLTSFTFDSKGNSVYSSTSDGTVFRFDQREPKGTQSEFSLHANKVGCVSFDPSSEYCLATCSNDRYMRVWDVRKLQKDESEYVVEFEHGMSVTSGYFSPVGSKFVSNSYDNKVRFFSKLGIDGSENDLNPKLAYHNNQSGRWVTLLR
jgi:WD40 repeat protein